MDRERISCTRCGSDDDWIRNEGEDYHCLNCGNDQNLALSPDSSNNYEGKDLRDVVSKKKMRAMKTNEMLLLVSNFEDEILEVVDNRDEYTRSDLQGTGEAIVLRILAAAKKLK